MDTTTRFAPNRAEVSAKILDGEAIIINVSNGMYYSMEGTGAFLWSELECGPTVSDLATSITSRFDVPEEQAVQDVRHLLESLLEEHLIEETTQPDPAGSTAGDGAGVPNEYAAPTLNKYNDMADLLALDPPMPMLAEMPAQSDER